ncbi:MAG: pantoate--beta-alanine ligase [Gemmatimonadota bacterium]
MKRAETVAAVRAAVADLRRDGRCVALVPTMGALHAGHESLVRRGGAAGAAVVLSTFVNPLQFGPGEDFESYPREPARDAALAAAWGVEALFAPAVSELLPQGRQVTVDPGPLGDRLEGRARPGHFRGVLTIVAKLLNAVTPDLAILGQKDLQQAVLVRAMVRDLDLPVRIDVAPVVREADGLALSSRNAYLSPAERSAAPGLHRALRAGEAAVRTGEGRPAAVREAALRELAGAPTLVADYLEVLRADDLSEIDEVRGPVALVAAARLGRTRLLDNVLVNAGGGT